MKPIFINHTNHPSAQWSEAQRRAAEHYGKIVDLSFPGIDAMASEDEVDHLADIYAEKIVTYQPAMVLCQGEFTYTYALVQRLHQHGIRVTAACSERIVEEKLEEDGSTRRLSRFYFVRFREYK